MSSHLSLQLRLGDQLLEEASLEDLNLSRRRVVVSHLRGIARLVSGWVSQRRVTEDALAGFSRQYGSRLSAYVAVDAPVPKDAVPIPPGMAGPYDKTIAKLTDLMIGMDIDGLSTQMVALSDYILKVLNTKGGEQSKIRGEISPSSLMADTLGSQLTITRSAVDAMFCGINHPRPANAVFHHRHNMELALKDAQRFLSAIDHLGAIKDRIDIVEKNVENITDHAETHHDAWEPETLDAVYRLVRRWTDISDVYGYLLHEGLRTGNMLRVALTYLLNHTQ